MKKIAFAMLSLENGGAERVLLKLANYFDKQGYDVRIFAECTQLHYPLNKGLGDYLKKPAYHKQSYAGRLASVCLYMRSGFKQFRPDVVVAFTFRGILLAWLASMFLGIRFVVSERNSPENNPHRAWQRRLRNFLFRRADACVFQTPDAMSYFAKSVQAKGIVISNPLPDGLPQPWTKMRTPIIVNFCRLHKQKNLPLLLSAYELLIQQGLPYSNYCLKIYGDGPLYEEINQEIQNRGLQNQVSLHRHVDNIHQEILAYSMFVSSSDHEGVSNSMLEAMAIGLPTICTDCPVGGARMTIENDVNGILVPVGDALALSAAMKRLIDDPSLAQQLSSAAQQVRTELSLDKIGPLWEGVVNPNKE